MFAAAGVLAAVALVARLPLLIGRKQVGENFDAGDYLLVADRIWRGDPFEAGLVPRTPGYAMLITPAIRLPFDDMPSIVTLQHLLGLLLVATIVLAAWRLFGGATAIGAGVLAAASPLMIVVEDDVLPDMAFAAILLAVATATGVLAPTAHPRPWAFPALGGLIGAAALIKPVGQVLVLAVPVALLMARHPWRVVGRRSALTVVAAALVISPWVMHNAIEDGRPVLSQQDGLTLFNRVFEVDKRPLPDSSGDDRLVRAVARQSARAQFPPENRLHSALFQELMRRGYTNNEAIAFERRYAREAIEGYPVGYAARTVAELPRTVVDVGRVPEERERPGDRADAPLAEAVAAPLWWLGERLSEVWVLATLFGALILITPFAGSRERRAAAAAYLAVWLLVALGTAASNGGAVRYSADLAPLTWILGTYGLVLAVGLARVRLAKPSR